MNEIPGPEASKPRRRRRTWRIVALSFAGLLVVALGGFVIFATMTFGAEPDRLAEVKADPSITYTESTDAVVLTPNDPTGAGLVFIAGARVEPSAYAWKLAGLAEAGVTVVIARPILNFAILEFRPIETFTSHATGVDEWFVGGHSLGGVRACQYLDDAAATGLVLLGSYCAVDVSGSDDPVLSISGSEDGLSTPAKIDDNAHLLPADATFIEIDGANHASFGDYGPQPGDGTATATDDAVRDEITTGILAAFGIRG